MNSIKPSDPGMKDFLALVKNRKSIRSFANTPIERKTIRDILAVATHAPTNCNQQLWNFVVVLNQKTKEQLVREAASNTLIRRAPVVIVITYDGWNYKEAIQGASLAVGNILLAAEYYGVHASPMNSYGADSKVKKILGIPDSETICCFVVLGHPDERARLSSRVPRRPVEETIHWDSFKKKRKTPFTYNPDDWTLEDLKNHQKYYCRKTFLGKEMDIMSTFEQTLVRKALKNVSGTIVDLFSYDGAYLKEFPNIPITTIDLIKETADYTRAAVARTLENSTHIISHDIYAPERETLTEKKYTAATMIYKIERIPTSLREKIFKQTHASLEKDGVFIIIARKSNIFLSLFFFIVKIFFGKDMRKTGIYNFFGPYAPISVHTLKKQLHAAGFSSLSWSGYFPIPAFYEQMYQMFLQYIKSEGSSYLHREKRRDVISAFLEVCMKIQGFKKVSSLGSVAVIICRK